MPFATGINGYGWLGEERVYNPFDMLLLFRTRQFAAHWFETGSPKFLIDTLNAPWRERRLISTAWWAARSCCPPSTSSASARKRLLFQGGYLTHPRG